MGRSAATAQTRLRAGETDDRAALLSTRPSRPPRRRSTGCRAPRGPSVRRWGRGSPRARRRRSRRQRRGRRRRGSTGWSGSPPSSSSSGSTAKPETPFFGASRSYPTTPDSPSTSGNAARQATTTPMSSDGRLVVRVGRTHLEQVGDPGLGVVDRSARRRSRRRALRCFVVPLVPASESASVPTPSASTTTWIASSACCSAALDAGLGGLEVLGRGGRGLLVERGDEVADRAEHRVDVGSDVVRHVDLAGGRVEVEVGGANRAHRPGGVLQAVVLAQRGSRGEVGAERGVGLGEGVGGLGPARRSDVGFGLGSSPPPHAARTATTSASTSASAPSRLIGAGPTCAGGNRSIGRKAYMASSSAYVRSMPRGLLRPDITAWCRNAISVARPW